MQQESVPAFDRSFQFLVLACVENAATTVYKIYERGTFLFQENLNNPVVCNYLISLEGGSKYGH